MIQSTLDHLAIIPVVEPGAATAVEAPLALRRAWSRGLDALTLEYRDHGGRVVPGQWRRSPEAFDRLFRAHRRVTGPARAVAAVAGAERVLLQPNGADAELPGLAGLLDEPGAELVSHRAGRRAVVRLLWKGRPAYAKALRPARMARIRESHEMAVSTVARGFRAASLLHVSEAESFLVFEALSGTPLNEVASTRGAAYAEGLRGAGAALRALHLAPVPPGLPGHWGTDEAELLREKLAGLEAFAPGIHPAAASAAERVLPRLAEAVTELGVIHRDFHDKQLVLVEGSGEVAMLDLDTLAVGEPALDLGNMLAHMELHELLGRCPARAAGTAFVEGYGLHGEWTSRVAVYRDAALLRLAMLYALWPQWSEAAPRLLERIGTDAWWDPPAAGVGRVARSMGESDTGIPEGEEQCTPGP